MEKKTQRPFVFSPIAQPLVYRCLWSSLVSPCPSLPLWRNSQEPADFGPLRFVLCGIFDFLLGRAFSLSKKEQQADDDGALAVRKSSETARWNRI